MPQMHKYGESKMTQIMMATVRHVTYSLGVRKFQATWFLLDRMYVLQGPWKSILNGRFVSVHCKIKESNGSGGLAHS